MIAAVLDTNVLASGFVGLAKPDSAPGELLRRWRAKTFDLVVSEPILVELTRVFGYPYFVRRLSPGEIEAALSGLRTEALLQSITQQVDGIAPHPKDDLILATAVSARAAYLVTGDRRLLEREVYRGSRLLDPRQFLDVLEMAATE